MGIRDETDGRMAAEDECLIFHALYFIFYFPLPSMVSPIFADMKFLIAGLGNIGNEYSHTRHNIGFDVAMAFASKHGGQFNNERLAYKSEVKWKGRIFICICPTTYMNLSGKSIKYWLEKEKIPVENSLTIVDEVALPLSRIRLRPGGSSGGHNGLKSIEESLGTSEYPKLRFGIGNHFPKGMQVDYVLGKWMTEEEPIVKQKIGTCIEVIEAFATIGIAHTMNKYNNVEITL